MTDNQNWVNRCPDCRKKVVHAFHAHTGNVIVLEDTFGESLFALVPGKTPVASPASVYRHHLCRV